MSLIINKGVVKFSRIRNREIGGSYIRHIVSWAVWRKKIRFIANPKMKQEIL